MKLLFVADPLAALDPSIDTTVGLMQAAQARGAEVWAAEAVELEAVGGRARARARRVRLAPSWPEAGHRWSVADPWFTAGEPRRLWLDDTAAVFLRTEPPLDEAYVNATHILELTRTPVVNDPRGIRACSEHLLPLRFPELIPPTAITSSAGTIAEFLASYGAAVVKPIDGFSGRGVLRLSPGDPNLPSLLELSTSRGTRAVIVQQYLSQAEGNKRLFVTDGEPAGAVYRYPPADDFRIKHPSAEALVTARDREICARLAPVLRHNGIRTAGFDIIGPHLIEVNVTSVGALRKADALLGWTLCADLLATVLDARAERRSA